MSSQWAPGRPQTSEAALKILERRERAVAMRARGYSYAEIARKEEVSWQTSYTDVSVHLEHCARYYSAAKNREQIAETYRETQREAEAIIEALGTSGAPEVYDLRLKALLTIQKAASGLARLYGFVGEKSFFLNLPNATAGEALMSKNHEWVKDLSPERAQELRGRIIDFYRARHEPAPIPAEFTVEEPDPPPEVAPPPPSVENGHAPNGDDEGPVTLRGG